MPNLLLALAIFAGFFAFAWVAAWWLIAAAVEAADDPDDAPPDDWEWIETGGCAPPVRAPRSSQGARYDAVRDREWAAFGARNIINEGE